MNIKIFLPTTIFTFFVFISSFAQQVNESDKSKAMLLIEKYVEAQNKKDFRIIRPFINDSCIPRPSYLELLFNY
jgi:hypothetical protein